MTKRLKLVEKVKNNPNDADFDEVRKMLLDAGLRERHPKSGSSHYVYYHDSLDRIVTLTKGAKRLPEYQVKDALRALQRLEVANEKE